MHKIEQEERKAKFESDKEIDRLMKKQEKLQLRKVREKARERVEKTEKVRTDSLISRQKAQELKVAEAMQKKEVVLSQKKQLAIIKEKEKEEAVRRAQAAQEYQKAKILERINEDSKRADELRFEREKIAAER